LALSLLFHLQLYNLNTKYGSQDELLSLNRNLMEAGIRCVLTGGGQDALPFR